MRKKSLIFLVLLFFVLQFNSQLASAEEANIVQGYYKYKTVSESSLSDIQKAQIVAGKPNKDTLEECHEVVLVYRSLASNQVATLGQKQLVNPNTGVEDNSLIYTIGGASLILAGIYLLYRKKGSKAVSTLAVVALVGFSSLGFASAVENKFEEKSGVVPVGEELAIPNVDGYEYVGYILEWKCTSSTSSETIVPLPIDDYPQNNGTTSSTSSEVIVPIAIPDDAGPDWKPYPPTNNGEEPAQPNTGEEPAQPNTGEEPAQPNTGEEPAQPNTGEEPAQPNTGEEPAQPNTGEEPAQPNTGEEPAQPNTGEEPAQPPTNPNPPANPGEGDGGGDTGGSDGSENNWD